MKRTFLAIGLVVSISLSMPVLSHAQTPIEVKDAYKAYKTALSADDKTGTLKWAYETWKAAEEHIGDSETTGSTAMNYARAASPFIHINRPAPELYEAYLSGIQNAKYAKTKPAETEFKRRIKLIKWVNQNTFMDRGKLYEGPDPKFTEFQKRLDETSYDTTVFAADMYALKSEYYYKRKEFSESEASARLGLDIYALHTDIGASKNETRAYRHLVKSVEAQGRVFDPSSLEKINERYALSALPLYRETPVIPFFKRSGWVKLGYNVTQGGRVSDIQVVESSEKKFEKNAKASLEKWIYAPNIAEEKRKGLTTLVRFEVRNGKRQLLSPKKPFPETE